MSESLSPAPATPSAPREIHLTPNARVVLTKRYLRRGPDGQPIESVEEMFERISRAVAEPDTEHGRFEDTEKKFFDLLTTLRFFPNSPTFTGAGTPLGQLAACFVLPIEDDMGREADGIFQTLRNAALIQQTGGGNGFSFARLRPKGDFVATSAGTATGPVGFLRVYDKAFGEVAQGGCLLPDTLVFTHRGLLRLDELVNLEQLGWQEHTLQVATDEGWRTSPRGYNNGEAPVYRIHTREGISIAGTANHKVKVMTREGLVWRAIEDLKPNDWLTVTLGEHRGDFQVLRAPQPHHANQKWPTFPTVLDEELAFFLGYLSGDGFVASREDDYRVGVTVAHSSYLMQEMPAVMQRLFGVTPNQSQKPDDASLNLVFDNRAVKEFLLLNGFGKARSRNVSVPRLIRQSPPEVVGAYLRGLLEADGALVHGYPSLTTTSARLAEEVATLLIGLGCPIQIRTMSAGLNRYGTAQRYQVIIRSAVGLEAWRQHIGCDKRSRFVVAYQWRADEDRESVYPLPEPAYWLEPTLSTITLEQIDSRGRGLGRKWRSTQPALRKALLCYVHGDRGLTRSAYDRLARSYPEVAETARQVGNLWFVRVTGVESLGIAATLDLEVDENHTYLANGLVVHNSRRGANMAVLRVDHPDIMEFIRCKAQEGQIANFNISVALTDDFMRAVKNDEEFDLINPRDNSVWKRVRAREVFDEIVKYAHHNGEPGCLFIDTANAANPVPHLYALESTNPCVTGDTRVATEFGLMRIADLAEMGIPAFVAADNRAPVDDTAHPLPHHGVALRPASPAWMTRRDTPVMKLTTKGGYSVTATPDHKFLTPRGYVALQDLKPGETVLLQSGEGAWSRRKELPNQERVAEAMSQMALGGDRASGALVQRRDFLHYYDTVPSQWSQPLGLVMGWLVGDGWLSETSHSPFGIVFAKSEMLALVHAPLQEWFGSGHVHERNGLMQLTYGRVVSEFFKSLGVLAVRAHEKRVPESLWTAPREAVVGFLQGLFSADGTVQLKGHNHDCTVRLASSSRGLLEDVQVLLSNFGIVGRIYTRRQAGTKAMPDQKGGLKDYAFKTQYELIIGRANRDRFASLIGFVDEDKQAIVAGYLASKKHASAIESFTDAIVSIEDAGVADVYDLSQPQTHSFIANGVTLHNCGEQWLGPYENCCLGSINLAQHITEVDGKRAVAWAKLQRTTEEATHFLDNVVSANKYVPAVPQLREAALRARRIGLGIMGLGDMMYALGVRYGSRAGEEFAGQIMEFVRYHCMRTSVRLAEERGPFESIRGSIYDPDNLKWQPPTPLTPYTHDWGRPAVDWTEIVDGIHRHGIRNAAQTTIAPTGTIATVAGCEGYGCEPVFALAYTRHVKDPNGGPDIDLTYASPLFEQALMEVGIDEAARQKIYDKVMRTGTCQDIAELPADIRDTFVVAGDITPEEHVRMQAAMQAFVDNSLSKTCNFPEGAAEADVAKAFMMAWELGCKGLTVYVTGSREQVVLETKQTQEAKQQAKLPVVVPKPRERQAVLTGKTYRMETPIGTAYVTINECDGEPYEVFINVGKGGSDVAAVSEALGRLCSLELQTPSPLSARDRAKEIIHKLRGISGRQAIGFGPQRVASLPDAIAVALTRYIEADPEQAMQLPLTTPTAETDASPYTNGNGKSVHRDLCPECGQATLMHEEGCRHCISCGYSKC